MIIYKLLDWFFVFFHLSIVIFNLFGWIWNRSRRLNLYLLLLTGVFWFGFGYFYGWGYCPLTDWHFQVLDRLGESPQEKSYIAYCIYRFFGLSFNALVVDLATLFFYLFALFVSIYMNIWNRTRYK